MLDKKKGSYVPDAGDLESIQETPILGGAAVVPPEPTMISSPTTADLAGTPVPKPTPWLRQLYWILYKNTLLLYRRPITIFFMIFSSVVSVLLSWPSGRDVDGNLLPERDQCGAVSSEIFIGVDNPWGAFRDYALTLNQSWSNGAPVMVISFGPFVHAVCVFLLVRTEIEAKLVGVLRGLGVRESIYWMGWLVPFTLSSFLNSLLGAITTFFIPVHVFRTVYFGGIFGSLFFLNLALTCASFFLAALCGGNRKLIILMIMAMGGVLFVPLGINQSFFPMSVSDFQYKGGGYGSPGLVWAHLNTAFSDEVSNVNDNYYFGSNETPNDISIEICEDPVLNEESGTFYKTEEERLAVTSDQMFFGCYVKPGFTSKMWNTNGGAGLLSLSMIPYFHFMTIYSNFLGFTGVPNNKFGLQEAIMSPEDLAVASSPNPSNYENSNGTDLFPQGSTLLTEEYYNNHEYEGFYIRNGFDPPNRYDYYNPRKISSPEVCPSQELPGFNFCYGMRCEYAKGTEALTGSPSVHDMFGYLFALSVVYVLMAAYWLQVFPAGNGARRKFYFFLDPRYWVSFRGGRDKGSDGTNSVHIKNVSKSFGSVEAVKDLTLELKRGQVTALLGHNGAGKSTLTNILSCEMDASKGEVIIFGKSIAVDPFSVRCLVGICKQDDFLWPDLSAKEHLDIFAGLRGVDSESHDVVVQKWLESVDLAVDQHKFSGTFSGGMKRRLSVALSTIGDRPFLIFDEPTTGMDPVNRRFVWQHLDDIKEDRVVLLTTHAMEEADLLADEVAIMKNGEMAANGSPLELKAGYGSAIQFSVLVEKEDVAMTEERIREMFADYIQFVSITGSDAGSLMVKFEKIQSDLDGHREGIPVSTLTKFVAWLESDESRVCEYGFSNSSLEEVFINIARDEDSLTDDEIVRKGCCCFGSARSYPTAINEAPEEPVDLEPSEDIITSLPTMNVQSQVVALLRLSMIRKWFGSKSIIEYVFFGIMILGTVILGLGVPSLGVPVELFQIVPVFALSVMLLSVIFPIYLDKTSGNYHFMLEHALSLWSYTTAIGIYAFFIQFIFGVILLTAYFLTPLFRETQFCENGLYYQESKFGSVYCGEGAQSQYLDSAEVARSPGGYGSMLMIAFGFALSMPGSVFVSSIIPGNYKFGMVIVGLCTLVACILPLGYIILTSFNVYGGSGYYDDDEGDLESFSNPIVECMKNIDPGGFCSYPDLTNFLALGYQLNCIGMEMIDSSNAGFISLISLCAPKYASLLPPFGAFQMLVTTLFSNIKIDGAPFDNDDYCNGETQQICKFPFAQKMHAQHRNFFFLGAILLNAIGLCVFVWTRKTSSKMSNLEDNIEDESEQIARQEVIDEKATVQNIVRPLLLASDIDAVEAANMKHVAIDYKAKSESSSLPAILMHKLRKVYPSSGKNPPKIALKALDLHVNKGQVCALLGKNGSGKTTALKILATSHSASSGLALVDGYDVNCEKSEVFENLGNCPQHDVVWPSLSVKDHLEFFAGLKGIRRGEIKESSHALAKAVGLGKPDVYNRAAGQLSGGMRRRLSIAISLTGAPSVLLLDEPTTGLDPSTRNEIWNLISSFATSERAIIITTHMMIEADTLCNRIAIIADGELRVVATQQHLKDKYGSGYVLQLNLVRSNEENREKAMSFVRERLHPGAVLDITQAKTLHIHLPKDINLDQVFAALYSPERSTEGCINQFLLSQSSLEDVFLACAR